ncbi:hypothetical protein V1509DRAFT_618107 [Lipomyces kononenkoae]
MLTFRLVFVNTIDYNDNWTTLSVSRPTLRGCPSFCIVGVGCGWRTADIPKGLSNKVSKMPLTKAVCGFRPGRFRVMSLFPNPQHIVREPRFNRFYLNAFYFNSKHPQAKRLAVTMPPARKPKQSLSLSKRDGSKKLSSSKKSFIAQSEDDFLYVGSVEEEHGDRWVASDPDKAHRFYIHALELYDTCLSRFANSFDAAYNKCRLEFHIYQLFYSRTILTSPPLRNERESSVSATTTTQRQDRVSVLSKILQDHEFAMQLALKRGEATQVDPPSDLLFNMAQVQLSIAEEQYAAAPYCAAMDIFEKAWTVQEKELDKLRQDLATLTDDVASSDAESSSSHQNNNQGQEEQEEYATVIEPTTYTSLLETAGAQLACLIPVYTISLSFSANSSGPTEDVEGLARAGTLSLQRIATLIANRQQLDIEDSDIQDSALIVARYVAVSGYPLIEEASRPAANLERLRTLWTLDAELPSSTLDFKIDLLQAEGLDGPQSISLRDILSFLPTTCQRYLAQADMFTQFGIVSASDNNGDLAWRALTLASQYLPSALSSLLQAATPTPGSGNIVIGAASLPSTKLKQIRIWITRGDVDIMRSQLAPISASADKNRTILRKNAEIYYKNAMKLASGLETDPEIADAAGEAKVKCSVILGDRDSVLSVSRWQEIMAEAIDDSVFSKSDLREVLGQM